jgi:hypothetical protein
MTRFRRFAQEIRKRFFPCMTKDQADILASVKFPCC